MPIYRFKCQTCQRLWETDTGNPSVEVCSRCNRLGVTTTVQFRAKRKDAVKQSKVLHANDLNVHSRPVRGEPRSYADMLGDSDDEGEFDGPLDLSDDVEWVPAPEFNPAMRFTSGGSFSWSRAIPGATDRQVIPWTRITASAGRGNTNAQFGGQTAQNHGTASAPAYVGQPSPTGGSAFEWCHLVADSLGGPTTAANLFCGTYHANTAMLCIEQVLRGKTEFEVQVEVDLRQGTHLAEKITYRVRRAPSQGNGKKRSRDDASSSGASGFSTVIDGLATGCTALDGVALSGQVRSFVNGR